jgi:hypothetical protein
MEKERLIVERALDKLARSEVELDLGAPWRAVHMTAAELGVTAPIEALNALAEEVLAAGKRWERAALGELWRVLGISLPPRMESQLSPEKASWETATVVFREGRKGPKVRVGFPYEEPLTFPLPKDRHFEPFVVRAWPGGMEVEVPEGLRARKGHAYMRADGPWGVEKASRGLRPFAPLLALLGLADLKGALLALEGLGDGEARTWGPYLLAREGHARVLFRGSLTGTPALDGALLLGREAVLLGTGGVAVRLKVKVEDGAAPRLEVEEGVLEWGGERARFTTGWERPSLYGKNAFPRFLREALRTALRAESAPSPRVRALVEELTAGENPLEALRARDLPRRVHLRLLSRL